ncbi:Histone H2B [Melia azedarach]|uniref:Histone H2B n=1 Tax=Melia azedarach TaxID=155640 RepID=A0ACC1YPP1_MELAZ|nr:Histone H2B [Melia azedarach]
MPPKRSARLLVTKKVVRETVQVSVVTDKKKDIADEELLPLKTIPIEDKEEEKHTTVQIPVGGPEPEYELEPSGSGEPEAVTPAKAEEKTKTIESPELDQHEPSAALEPEEPTPSRKEDREKSTEGGKKRPAEPEKENENKTAQKEGNLDNERSKSKSKRKRRKRSKGNEGTTGKGYKTYVFRVLKQVHPGMAISSMAMTVINNLMNDMFERIAGEAATLSKYNQRRTLSSREIQGAVKLVLPGELGKHAIAEGTKAVNNYMSNRGKTTNS